IGTGHARRARSRTPRPRQGRTVGLRGIGGGEHEALGLLVLDRTQLPQSLDGARERELCAAEAFDEVAAAADAERLERLQLSVDHAVAAGDPLAADAVAGDDPLPLEQELGERAALGSTREQALREGPAAQGRR